ncbi:MAG: hypothetical protein CSA35_05135 [Dethiosulfovibrio peptidovorans]|nr:MAG: hypothetical protein CSA35_05135 [Dethiosulfovibrio peptidovorans]
MEKKLEAWLRDSQPTVNPSDMGLPVVERPFFEELPSVPVSSIDFLREGASVVPKPEPQATFDQFRDPGDSFVSPVQEDSASSAESQELSQDLSSLGKKVLAVPPDQVGIQEEQLLFQGEVSPGGDVFSSRDEPEDSSFLGRPDEIRSETIPLEGRPPEQSSPFSTRRRRLVLGGGLLLVAAVAAFLFHTSPQKRLEKADQAFLKGEYKDALTLYDQVEQRMSLPMDASIKKGEALIRMGRSAEALDAFYSALSLDPENFDLHRRIGDVLMYLGSVNQAEKSYKEVLRFKPDDKETLLALTRIRLHNGASKPDISPDMAVVISDDVTSFEVPISEESIVELPLSVGPELPSIKNIASAPFVPVSSDKGISMDALPCSEDVGWTLVVSDISVQDRTGSPDLLSGKNLKEELAIIVSSEKIKEEKRSTEQVQLPRSPKQRSQPAVSKTRRLAQKKETPQSPLSPEEVHFKELLRTSRPIDKRDAAPLRALVKRSDGVQVLYRLAQDYNRSGRFREALLFLERALALNGNQPWLLAETAYSYDAIGRDRDALAVLQHGLLHGDGQLENVEPPTSIVQVPLQSWDIGWKPLSELDERIVLYSSDEALTIPGVEPPVLPLNIYLSVERAVQVNEPYRALYIGYVALWGHQAPKPSDRSTRAMALAMEAHGMLSIGRSVDGLALLRKAEILAPEEPFIRSLREVSSRKL